jgi:hypothetical protein
LAPALAKLRNPSSVGCDPRQSAGDTWAKFSTPEMHVSHGCDQFCVGTESGRIAHPDSRIVLQTRTRQRIAMMFISDYPAEEIAVKFLIFPPCFTVFYYGDSLPAPVPY